RERHGMEGGEEGPENDVVAEWQRGSGAVLMGRRMFSGGSGPWEDDPNADGGGGRGGRGPQRGGGGGTPPPFHAPVFVVTHQARGPVEKSGGTTYNFVDG